MDSVPTDDDNMITRRIIAVCGLPGVGKTTAAERLADMHDAQLIRSDVVRKDLVDEPTYSSVETDMTYEEMHRRITASESATIILDATYRKQRHRELLQEKAEQHDAILTFIKVTCSEQEVKRRLENREDDASDADYEVYQSVDFEPIDGDHITVKTG